MCLCNGFSKHGIPASLPEWSISNSFAPRIFFSSYVSLVKLTNLTLCKVMPLINFFLNTLTVDFGVSAQLDKTVGRRNTFIGTPYWYDFHLSHGSLLIQITCVFLHLCHYFVIVRVGLHINSCQFTRLLTSKQNFVNFVLFISPCVWWDEIIKCRSIWIASDIIYLHSMTSLVGRYGRNYTFTDNR